jgi:hypothetical protein
LREQVCDIPASATVQYQLDGFAILESGRDLYLSDGASVFHVQPDSRTAQVWLAPTFQKQSALRQASFWNFGLLKLLRLSGFYSLHAAGLAGPLRRQILIVGESGSGKSTLALGLIRHGWEYLSDDAVLLESVSGRVRALALRKHFYIDAADAVNHSDLPLDAPVQDKSGSTRRRVRLEDTPFAARHIRECVPNVLVFSRIDPHENPVLKPLANVPAMKRLLEAAGPQLFDSRSMPDQFRVLTNLMQQCRKYELAAAPDLRSAPETLLRLLNDHDSEETVWAREPSSN